MDDIIRMTIMPSIYFEVTTVLYAFVVGLFLMFVYRRHKRIKQLEKIIEKIPGPVPQPIFGNALQIISHRSEIVKRIGNRFKTFGPIFRIWFGSEPMINISTAEQAEVILSSSKHLEKSVFYRHLDRWLGEGLLLAKGARWFTHRKLLTPTFHFKILEIFQDIFTVKSDILVKRLEKYSITNEIFDLYSFISSATLDIICETALGINIKAQEETQSEYVKSIYNMTQVISYRNRRIWLHPEFIFNLTTYGNIFNKCLNVLHSFTKNIIKERKSNQSASSFTSTLTKETDDIGSKRKVALLDLLLEAEKNGANITEKAICEEVDTFTFEGHDTTSTGISFAIFLLGCHPEIQEQVYEEINGIIHGEERPITLADLGEMKVLERVIKETLRLYPPVPIIGRVLDDDVVIDGYEIPKGLNMGIFLYFIHRDPRYYPDPEKFDPDRFLAENTKNRHPFAYIPFSAGSRNCIGQRFAMYEEKTILASILRKYKITSIEKQEDLNILFELVLRSENGLKIKLEKRM